MAGQKCQINTIVMLCSNMCIGMMNFARAEPDVSLLIYVLTYISAVVYVKVRRKLGLKKPQSVANFLKCAMGFTSNSKHMTQCE